MTEIDTYIDIKPSTKAKDTSFYRIKELEFDHPNVKIEVPYKIMEGKNLSENVVKSIVSGSLNQIFESGNYLVRSVSWEKFHNVLTQGESEKTRELDSMLGIRKTLWNKCLTTVSFMFSRNPFIKNFFPSIKGETKIIPPLDKESYDTFLDHIHSASSALILTPDIRIEREKIISTDNYLKFINESVKILSEFNKKAIFVPIQVDISQKKIRKILEDYKKNGYYNLWINFKAQQIGGTYFSRVRTLLRLINEILDLDNVVLYSTHLKREVTPNIKDDYVLGSDILSQYLATDFVGINREPIRMFNKEKMDDKIRERVMKGEFRSKQDFEKELVLHKSRLFDPETYYYYKITKYPREFPVPNSLIVKNKEINRLVNSILLFSEIERTKRHVEEHKHVKPYLKTKKSLTDNPNVIDGIIDEPTKHTQSELLDFLSKV